MGEPRAGTSSAAMWTAPGNRNENRAGGRDTILRLWPRPCFDMVAKGSVAVDGVSLDWWT